MSYADFLRSKLHNTTTSGIPDVGAMPSHLFPFQADLTRWALRGGRRAIFAATGLGKMRMELTYAHFVAEYTKMPVIVLAPLAVAQQIRGEGQKIGVEAFLCRSQLDVPAGNVIVLTNYERLHLFRPSHFACVVLDESGIIKHYDSKTLTTLLEAFGSTPYRLAATATPAPNDWSELGTHAEFLGVCTREEMLAEFFCHDGGETQKWRLKGHARDAFWKWLASWGAMIRRPSDLGYEDGAYNLPPFTVHKHVIPTDEAITRERGLLFAEEARTLSEQRAARRASLPRRVSACVDLVNSDDQPWVVWTDLNAESEALSKAIRGAIEVKGADPIETKERNLVEFSDGKHRVMVSKPSIAGHGLCWHHCARVAFVGVTHSWESYFQAIRRCWRFGQTKPVEVHIFVSDAETRVLSNLERKERDAVAMAESLAEETRAAVLSEVRGITRTAAFYNADKTVSVPSWLTTEGV